MMPDFRVIPTANTDSPLKSHRFYLDCLQIDRKAIYIARKVI